MCVRDIIRSRMVPPDKDGSDGGNTVFIDTSALGELSSQLTPQDLESLVGFNIQPADLEALQEATEGHVSCIKCCISCMSCIRLETM